MLFMRWGNSWLIINYRKGFWPFIFPRSGHPGMFWNRATLKDPFLVNMMAAISLTKDTATKKDVAKTGQKF